MLSNRLCSQYSFEIDHTMARLSQERCCLQSDLRKYLGTFLRNSFDIYRTHDVISRCFCIENSKFSLTLLN